MSLVNTWRLYAKWNKPCLNGNFGQKKKRKKALHFKLSNGPVLVLVVPKVDSWNRFQIGMCWRSEFCWQDLSKARSTSSKQQENFWNDQIQKERLYKSQIWKKASVTIWVSFGVNTIGIEITPISVFEQKQSSQVTATSMVQFQARML